MEAILRYLERSEDALGKLRCTTPRQIDKNLMAYAQSCALVATGRLLLRISRQLEAIESSLKEETA